METKKPQKGGWDDIQSYPEKIKFETGTPVVVTFPTTFENPIEMPDKDGTGVFYIFNVFSEGADKSIVTSSFTLLRSLKTHMPLAGKTLIVTKKNVAGKNMFYVETTDKSGSLDDSGIDVEEVDTDD